MAKKTKVIRMIDELPKKLQTEVGDLFDKRAELKEIEDELKVSKEETTNRFLDIIYDDLQIDGIKREINGVCQTISLLDKAPTIGDDEMRASLKQYFMSVMADPTEAMILVDSIVIEVNKTKEERLRDALVMQKAPPVKIQEIILGAQKESKLSVTFRQTVKKGK